MNKKGLKAADAADVREAQARSEVQEYLHVSQQRRRLFPRAALVGLLAGLVAVAFRAVLAAADDLRGGLILRAHHDPVFGWWVPVCFCAIGASLSVFLVRRFAPEAAGSGIPHLEAVLHRYRDLLRKRLLPVKFCGGALAIGGGLALGREGPTVQMGGAVGAAVSGWLEASTRERLTLIAAGAGAGLAAAFDAPLAAAFDAPLAGVIFVLEEVQKDFRQAVFGSAFVAAAAAAIVTRFASGQLPDFRVPSYPVPALAALPAFAVLGLAAGLLGVAYNRSLVRTLDLFAKVPPKFAVLTAALVGGVVGLVAWVCPAAGTPWPRLSWRVMRRQMLPLLVACFCAYLMAEGLGELPIYENLLGKDLMRGGALPDPKGPLVLELEIEPGSPFEGREVREIGLPPGCILVSCREGSREWMPTAGTRLEAHLRVTAMVAPEAAGAAGVLRNGCEAAE